MVAPVALKDWPVAPPGAVLIAKVTLTPLTGFPFASLTVTTRGFASGAPVTPLWPLPEVKVSVLAAPATTVKAALVPAVSVAPAVRVAVTATPVSALL